MSAMLFSDTVAEESTKNQFVCESVIGSSH